MVGFGLGQTYTVIVTTVEHLTDIVLPSGPGLARGGASAASGGVSAAAGTTEAGGAALENTISAADLSGIDAAAGGIGGGASAAPGALEIATSWDAPATAIELGSSASAPASVTSMPSGLLGSSPATVAGTPAVADVGAPATTANSTVAPPAGTDTNAISQWWSKQPESVRNRILQMGGNFAGSLFDGWSQEQKMALQREQQNLEKKKYDTMMSNGSAQPVVQFQAYKPAGGGLLGANRG